MNRPRVLYHGSQEKGLQEIIPHSKSKPKGFDEGDVIFATPDFTFALSFLIPWGDSWVRGGTFNDIPYLIISNKDRFLSSDHGGTIYTLPIDTFQQIDEYEWFSTVPVTPIDKRYFPNALNAMIEHGIQIYFVDKKTFKKIIESKDQAEEMVKNLVSENERLKNK